MEADPTTSILQYAKDDLSLLFVSYSLLLKSVYSIDNYLVRTNSARRVSRNTYRMPVCNTVLRTGCPIRVVIPFSFRLTAMAFFCFAVVVVQLVSLTVTGVVVGVASSISSESKRWMLRSEMIPLALFSYSITHVEDALPFRCCFWRDTRVPIEAIPDGGRVTCGARTKGRDENVVENRVKFKWQT